VLAYFIMLIISYVECLTLVILTTKVQFFMMS